MNVTAAQYSQLVTAFRTGEGKVMVDSLLRFLGAQPDVTPLLQAQIAALQTPRLHDFPARSLDTEFTVSTTRESEVSYTVALVASATLLGLNSDTADVNLYINGNLSAPNKNQLDATLGLGLSFTVTQHKTMTARVPAGATVQLVSSGTGTKTLLVSREVLL